MQSNTFIPNSILWPVRGAFTAGHVGISILLFMTAISGSSAEPQGIRLGDPSVPGQMTFYGQAQGGGTAGLPVATGDFNGDTFLDHVHTPMTGNVNVNGTNRSSAGLANIYFGDGTLGGSVDFANPPANTAIFLGAKAGDILGDEVWAGDVNGDNIDDILLCAQDTDGPSGTRVGAGSLYIIFGNAAFSGTIDLATPPAYVTQIHGAETEDRLGIWVRSAELNNDLIDDIIVGADGADGPGNSRPNAGSAYIIFGTNTWQTSIDMASPPPGRSVLFHGIDNNDRFGGTVSVGDINGDGLVDALISAALNRSGAALQGGPGSGGGDGPNNNESLAGETMVFFNPGVWPTEIDAASPPASVSATIVYGERSGDACGEEVLGADMDGDGCDELIVGALTADPLGRGTAGIAYILTGGKSLENRTIDLANPPGDIAVTEIFGAETGDISADTMIGGDVDNDGFMDLMNGSPLYDVPGGTNAGRLDILFGQPDPFPSTIDLAAPPANVRMAFIEGPRLGDILCYSLTAGDWDKDGYADPMPNGMNADGFNDAIGTAGDAYIVSGSMLAQLAPTFTITQTPTQTNTPTQTFTPTETSTITQTVTETGSHTGTPTSSLTPTLTPTATQTNTSSPTGTSSPTQSSTVTSTPSPTSTRSADLNLDGIVDEKDLLILLREIFGGVK